MNKYTQAGLAKLRAIQEKYSNTPMTPLPDKRVDLFGTPINQVSPRVQRIRDLQAGKRVQPLRPDSMVWHDLPEWKRDTCAPEWDELYKAAPVKQDNESLEDWTERMKGAMDKAADIMENDS